jgi:uncharacterized repeat protein (TIGR03803 family)
MHGYGTIFRISPDATYTTLYSFGSFPNDGQYPYAGLVLGSDGNFYGTAQRGGVYGYGTVFRITPSGTETNLYSFAGYPSDGFWLENALVQGSDGNFYGTSYYGGTSINCPGNGCGTVFRIYVPLNPPANQISALQLFSIFDSTGVATLIPSVAGESYQLQYSDSMSPTNWIDTGGPVTSIGGPMILIDLAGVLPQQRFYRAVITP